MSSYVFMKVLESSPARYDLGIRLLSGGNIGAVYQHIAERAARPGAAVLDIGCGTGGLSLACAARGAHVTGIDINAGMLQVAEAKPVPAGGTVDWLTLGAMEIEDRFPERSFDAVVSCLAFSELLPEERDYVLSTVRSRLRPGGVLVLADEVRPQALLPRLLRAAVRLPVAALTYLLTQTTTRPVAELGGLVRTAGFDAVETLGTGRGGLEIVFARNPEVP